MGQEIIKRFLAPSLDGEERKSVRPLVVWVIIGAILFLALGNFRSDKPPKEEVTLELSEEAEEKIYREDLEQRLQETLEKITGVGVVSVFLYFEDGGERVLAANRTQTSEEEKGERGTISHIEEEYDVIRWEKDGEETPYRVRKRFPAPTGILVVAEGAKDDGVRQEIYEAVRAVFGMSAHRIKITN